MELAFSKGLYEKSALLKAAYSFTEVAYLHLSQDDKNWYVSWHNKPGDLHILIQDYYITNPAEKQDNPQICEENFHVSESIFQHGTLFRLA